MTVLTDTFTLNNGVKIPQVGFGTWQIPDGPKAYDAVMWALEAGYRHIDTAFVYGNEVSVGKALRDSGLPRDAVFVTSKLPAQVKDKAGVQEHFKRTLDNLDIAALDLYLIHAPWPWGQAGTRFDKENLVAWDTMTDFYADHQTRAIGVSNFDVHDLENLLTHGDCVPAVDQIQYYIGATEPANTAYAQAHEILVEAYSPLATGDLLDNAAVQTIAARYDVSISQLALRFVLQNGVLPLPKATSQAHIQANTKLDFKISEADMQTLNAMADTAPAHGHNVTQK
ncbi:MAG: aldo/keto reductase [Lactobacillus sp.]|jgi:diketogulonate reductase-like aldo/keto reductase|nr:aldo/keto reductase [Lactobacillus sp.]MCI2032361.1 aldo/keto reductase [Lactobacillus sp.]